MTTGNILAVACRYSFAGLQSGPELYWLPPARACLLHDAWKDCAAGKGFDGSLKDKDFEAMCCIQKAGNACKECYDLLCVLCSSSFRS